MPAVLHIHLSIEGKWEWPVYQMIILVHNHFSVFLAVLDEFLLTSVQIWEKKSDLKNLTKS
jgi:hypothetical protein